MNKKLLAALIAGLLLVTAVSCSKPSDDPTKDTEPGTPSQSTGDYINVGTDTNGNTIVTPDPDTDENETAFDPSEDQPTFADVQIKVIVISGVATVRSETIVNETTGVAWPKEGATFDATGESENWYRIIYNDEVRYIAKTVAADIAGLEGFTAVNEQVTISTGNEGGAVNVRSYPSTFTSNSIRGTLKEGAVVTRVGVGEKWSKILFEVVSETETDAEGQPVKVMKEYYVSNDCIKGNEVADTDTETVTDAADTKA